MDNTTTDVNTSQSAADVSRQHHKTQPTTLMKKSPTDGLGDKDSGEQSEGELQNRRNPRNRGEIRKKAGIFKSRGA